jgi:hypothetical protein
MINFKTFSTITLGSILFTVFLQNEAFGASFQGSYSVSFTWIAEQLSEATPGTVNIIDSPSVNANCQVTGGATCAALPPSSSTTRLFTYPEAQGYQVDFNGGSVTGNTWIGIPSGNISAFSEGLSNIISIANNTMTGKNTTIYITDASYSYDLNTDVTFQSLGNGGSILADTATVGFDFTIKEIVTDLSGNFIASNDLFSAARTVTNGADNLGTIAFDISTITVAPNTIASFFIDSTNTLRGNAEGNVAVVPEPSSTLNLFAFVTLGAASSLKRKQKSIKSIKN